MIIKSLNPKQLFELLKQQGSDYLLVDVREPSETAEGFIPGAQLIPLRILESMLQAKSANTLELSRPFIFYCRSGRRSDRAAQDLLRFAPESSVSVLEGGFLDWQLGGFPVASCSASKEV